MTRSNIYLQKAEFLKPYISMAETDYKSNNLTFEQCVNKLRNIAFNNNKRIGRPTIAKLLKEEIDCMKEKHRKWKVKYRS